MKKEFKIAVILLALINFSHHSFSQSDGVKDYEAYSKANIAFTNFRMLGINANEYARTVESINYQDPSLPHKIVIIEGVQFADNGKNYDQKANDGILTSITSFSYAKGAGILAPGEYQAVKNNFTVYDAAFHHADKIGEANKTTGWSIVCKFVWVKCSSWPLPLQQVCRDFSWPFDGGFEIAECTFKFEK